ncbi:hypothetical protein B0H19DRAFT_1256305 [Mycena capillaripes]|nr:hypothetical protein B0H19DRAFT_1256305 [Mycena capillaripes]
MSHPDFPGLSPEVIKVRNSTLTAIPSSSRKFPQHMMYHHNAWLKGLLMLSMAMAPALAGPAPASSATASTSSSGPSKTTSNSTKRIVQYYGSPLEASHHVHIAQLVNSTRPIYATNFTVDPRISLPRFQRGLKFSCSPDFQTGTFPLSDLHAVFANITAKHPRVRGMAGFDYYDQCPGGWAAPWQWPIWAAAQLGIAPANATQSFQHGIKSCGANRV